MDHKIGFIGAGNMAEAIISGLVTAMPEQAASILAFDLSDEKLAKVVKKYNLTKNLNRISDQLSELLKVL